MEDRPGLLDDLTLEISPVVANSAMNRERGLRGRNSYALDLGFDPLQVLLDRGGDPELAWLDLCCGRGRALIQAAEAVRAAGLERRILLHGVDLVPRFDPVPAGLTGLRLEAASLNDWSPARAYDLITCVHGLHYVGDKLGLIARAMGWLAEGGRLAAHLDLGDLRLDGEPADRRFARALRDAGLAYDFRKRLLQQQSVGSSQQSVSNRCGAKEVRFPFRYLGADDRTGPNYTGQPSVTSFYSSQ